MGYGDWARAFEVLVPLAGAGHCEAARLSVMLHQQGARLFGGSFPATGAQRSGGSLNPISPFQAMQQRRDSPAVERRKSPVLERARGAQIPAFAAPAAGYLA